MKIGQLNKLKKKAIKEAQREIDKIFNKYSKLINQEIASQIPSNQTLHSYNGLCVLIDDKGNIIKEGNTWSTTAPYNPKMDFIAELQYPVSEELKANFDIQSEIKGKLK
ncbi:MAG: hypothetical protein LBL58_13930 [Tannerellaceae bacterium]|jgi:hypothetical protein|nr:hypothetical protein [Tannerellaceae bacterium]